MVVGLSVGAVGSRPLLRLDDLLTLPYRLGSRNATEYGSIEYGRQAVEVAIFVILLCNTSFDDHCTGR